MKKLLSILLTAVFLLCCIPPSVSAAEAKSSVGENLSGFSTSTLTGEPIDGSVFSEHDITVLHYFATWSADCVYEIGYMQELTAEFGFHVGVIGMLHEDNQSTPEAALELFDELGASYPAVHLDEVLLDLVSLNPYIPQTFFVDSEGNIISEFIGTFPSYSHLVTIVKELLPDTIPYHTVNFYDSLPDTLLRSCSVIDGGSVTPPHPPAYDDYEFDHWEGNYEFVTQDEDVYAIYTALSMPPVLGDVNFDGVIDATDVVLVLRMVLLDFPTVPEADFDLSGSIDSIDAIMILRFALGLNE